jgi:para-aminobenzoate synthetase component 1
MSATVAIPAADVEPARPLVEELTPVPDPWEVARRLAHHKHLLFLDSATSASPLGRYSFVTCDPFDWLLARGNEAHCQTFSTRTFHDPFALLAEQLARFPAETVPGLPPFQGGAAGLFSYDLCHHLERLPRPRCDDFELPDMMVGFYDWVIAFDHHQQGAWLISTGFPEMQMGRRRRRAARRLRLVRSWLQADPLSTAESTPVKWLRCRLGPQHPAPGIAGLASNFDKPGYLAAVRRAIEYIHAGDCFQVNLAQRLLVPQQLSTLELYGRLRQRNPAPFGGLLESPGLLTMASASPERFLKVNGGVVEARPIKGTRPRGTAPDDDRRQRQELLASAKDRAENVMIVDLLRNDLGRVCAYGSVQVPAVCQLESYPFVHHLVSVVRGRLRPGLGAVDLLRAAFPGGSVTGAPKIRAMEIIAELEPTARGPYCGCLGYIGFDGNMDTSILIRTFTIGRGWVQFPVGGGIVAESDPEREYEETWHKAEGMLRSLP